MSTSQTATLSEPIGNDAIAVGTLGYFRTRNRLRLYSLVIDEFERSQISQATLARRLRKAPEVISRWLAAPGNWTLDTASDLLFAINGGEASYSVAYPLLEPARNSDRPDWLSESADATQSPPSQAQDGPLPDMPFVRNKPRRRGLDSLLEGQLG